MLLDVILILLSAGVVKSNLLPQCSPDEKKQISMKYIDPENEKNYFTCENGIFKPNKCENNKVFDVYSLECIERFTEQTVNKKHENFSALYVESISNDQPFKCPSYKEKDYPVKDDCRKYYHCKEGVSSICTCPKYFLFDIDTSQCQLCVYAHCYGTPTTPYTPICPADEEINIPDPSDCKKYFHCSYGKSELKECGFLQRFDANKLKCRFILFAKCKKNSQDVKEILSDHTKKELNNVNNRQLLSSLTLSENYKCTAQGTYDDVYPGNCHKYYHCNEGILTVKSCPFLKNFCPIQLQCRWFYKVKCHATTTTTTTTTTSTTTTTTEPISSVTVFISTTKSTTRATTKPPTTTTTTTKKHN